MTPPERKPAQTVLALNSGSSSLKFGLYRVGGASLGGAGIEGTRPDVAHAEALLVGAYETASVADQREAMRDILACVAAGGRPRPDAIGHRVVHGGPGLQRHVLIDAAVMAQLEAAAAFAPLHTPAALGVIRLAQRHFAATPQVVCLDTAFHADMPAVARTLPIAHALRAKGLRRYGFHGLSCESIVQQLQPYLPSRLVIAHLGQGASVTAVRDGRSIDTSMGLTPAGGVMMGTRSGDLDPGLLVYLVREKRLDADGLEDLVNHQCGLLGVSGLSADMRKLRAAAGTRNEATVDDDTDTDTDVSSQVSSGADTQPDNDPNANASAGASANPGADAALAIAMFCRSVVKQIASMTASLGGIDMIVFTGGIGENDALAREAIVRALAWIGRFDVRILPALEEAQMARRVAACCRIGGGAA